MKLFMRKFRTICCVLIFVLSLVAFSSVSYADEFAEGLETHTHYEHSVNGYSEVSTFDVSICTHDGSLTLKKVSSNKETATIQAAILHTRTGNPFCHDEMSWILEFSYYPTGTIIGSENYRTREGTLAPNKSAIELLSIPVGYTLQARIKTTVDGASDTSKWLLISV